MKWLFISLIVMPFAKGSVAQNNYDINPMIEVWQRGTISIGNLKSKEFNNRKYPYYNILGTGIITYIKIKDSTIPVIITAKHVLQNKSKEYYDTIRIRFSWENDKSVYENLGYRVVLKEGRTPYFFTLPDSTIDLACVPLTQLIDTLKSPEPFKIIPYSLFAKDEDYFEGRDIYLLGYPASVGSNYWTRGLLRKGIISWLPNSGIGNKKFIIDCNVYPGNSGGPVFSFPQPGTMAYASDTAILNNKLLGIVIERRFNYNVIVSANNEKKILDSLQVPESMGVGIVEPAVNVLKMLRYTEKVINEIIANEDRK